MADARRDLTAFADECLQTALEIDRLRDPSLETAVTVFLEVALIALVERQRRNENECPPFPP